MNRTGRRRESGYGGANAEVTAGPDQQLPVWVGVVDGTLTGECDCEWLEGTVPDTYLAVSPHRLEHMLGLIGDWIEGEVTTMTRALLPGWVAFLACSANLPQHALDASLAALGPIQAGTVRDGGDCPGAGCNGDRAGRGRRADASSGHMAEVP